MDSPVVGGLLAFLFGAAVSVLNYWINRRTLQNNPAMLANMAVVRQILSVGCLVAVFLLAKVLPWDYVPLLIGVAVGLTVPAILLSFRLARLNDAASAAQADTSSEKGDDSNG